jgi:hypothetical protein
MAPVLPEGRTQVGQGTDDCTRTVGICLHHRNVSLGPAGHNHVHLPSGRNLLNRQSSGMNSLLASAFILTAVHPGVIFEAGFQLSYLAVGFIIAFYNSLYRLLRLKNRIPITCGR